jgi:hypothetical protein
MEERVAATHGHCERRGIAEISGRELDGQLPQIALVGTRAHQGPDLPAPLA